MSSGLPDMPPRDSPDQGGPRGGRRPRRGHRGGAAHGSQSGSPSSTNTSDNPNTTPQTLEDTPPQANPPSASRRSDNRGRGRGRRATPGSPLNISTTPVVAATITTETGDNIQIPSQAFTVPPANPLSAVTPENRGRGRGRRGRGAIHGNPPENPSNTSVVTTLTAETASAAIIPQSIDPSDSPSPTPSQVPANTTPRVNVPSAFAQPSGTRGRAPRGRGASPGDALGSPLSATTPLIPATIRADMASNFPSAFRGQPSGNRGGGGGHRGRFQGGRPYGGYGGGGGGAAITDSIRDIPDHIKTFGAKRPGFGKGGRVVDIIINAFPTTLPDVIYHQYDAVHNGKLPARLNMELVRLLQDQETTVFTPRAAYDGQRMIFSVRELPLGPTDSQKFSVSLSRSNGGHPKIYDITLTKTAILNSELLRRYASRELSHDDNVSTVLAALNVAVKMEPNQIYPFNKRSFYIPDGRVDIGGGIELWRGIFQSVRPTLDRLFVNIDLSTGMMYKEGPLVNLCIDFFGRRSDTSPKTILVPGVSLGSMERVKLQKFLSGVRVKVPTTGDKERVVRGLSTVGAHQLTFETQPGVQTTVAQYFQSLGITLQYPTVICALVGKTAMVPLELCTVPRGQFMRKQIPDDKVKDVLNFSTKKPQERLESIKKGLQYLRYGQSEYVRTFGMSIDENPLSTKARIIAPPKLKYNEASRQPSIESRDLKYGAWNMMDKKFYQASTIVRWVVVIYDSQRNFPRPAFTESVDGFLKACDEVGIKVENRDPIFKLEDGQGPIDKHLMNAVNECQRQFRQRPTLIVVILPNNGGDIYNAVKHFGDITFGIPTQCLKSFNCRKAKQQYWNNVMLKVNVKLGGINVIPDPSSLAASALLDPENPTIVMGADVAHPPPGVNRPSYTAIIGSIDSHAAKYVATSRAQKGRQEIINDMQEMCMSILGQYKEYQVEVEKKRFALSRLIFYRDGVSDSQFKQVLELELPMIKAACEEFGVNPKITLIIVAKRHHIQFFPLGEGDKSGNCPAGTVVDTAVTHPTDHDFYLQSHAGILGTSRPAHYAVLYDDSGFSADALQSLSYSLCHLYAPATRSVSVPAPVYYADMVCDRAMTHFDPNEHLKFDESSIASGSTNLETFKSGYKPLHANQQKAMYFA